MYNKQNARKCNERRKNNENYMNKGILLLSLLYPTTLQHNEYLPTFFPSLIHVNDQRENSNNNL